ncbi:ribosomal maturation YjgA family protein [Flavobacterium turcicum]|uniref:DUF2809 domain-containing protein n=1 Tax=Flavobacterium turcicum TaxID=2764718 RepID=A0ABR7JHW7_9FLAO|nr:DUF2809 domain-containing protein [Flavobacterium turcicum]MBC5864091.1 DUF2809 domain-containing protein [Flavobacterium turcicum]NHL02997.1 DUF2809 domain-containing protein [Flavobacterium turcicum]
MIPSRKNYLAVAIITILLGLCSRGFSVVPLFVGDLLYAVLIYFIFRFFFTTQTAVAIAIMSLSFCFAIETLQLVRWNWLLQIRATIIGRLVLGQDFLLEDLIAYTFGVFVAVVFERMVFKWF